MPGDLIALRQAALDYAARGWRVFPCHPGRKTPALPNGHHGASCRLSDIARWWAATPHNVAIAVAPSRLFVVDVDTHGKPGLESLAKLEAELGPLPQGAAVRTARGGYHLYFEGFEGQRRAIGFRPGVDLIGDGYVVAPPSVLDPDPEEGSPGGHYEWVRG